jgi:hypothetical protein
MHFRITTGAKLKMTDMIDRVAKTAQLSKGSRGSMRLDLSLYFYPDNKGAFITTSQGENIGVANDAELLSKLEAICKAVRKTL